MPKDDKVRLRHMLDASRKVMEFVQGRTRADLKKDEKLTLALVRLIEVIGEAATQVSKEFQELHQEIPWSLITGMRNRLIHAYFDVDLDRVWDTAKDDLPPLIFELEKIVS